MQKLRFKQVDVFTQIPFKGNPVAVVFDSNGQLSTEKMQQIANWTNLSETTFVIPKLADEANYRLRIFTPASELPFAGHPTIGTAHALLEDGLIKVNNDGILWQECNAGLIKLKVLKENAEKQWISFELPKPKFTKMDAKEINELENIFGDSSLFAEQIPRIIDVGPRWVVVQFKCSKTVLGIQPDSKKIAEFNSKTNSIGIIIFGEHEKGAAAKIEVRAFAPLQGVNEDAVCGSGNGCVGAFIHETGQIDHFGSNLLSTQGAALGRAGLVRILLEKNGKVKIGGMAVTVVDGEIFI